MLTPWPPVSQNVAVFGDKDSKEVMKLKWESLGWDLTQYDWGPYKTERLGHRYTEWRLVKQETQVRSLDREDPLEEEMATHSSILAWKTPWIKDPSRLLSIRLTLKSQTRQSYWAHQTNLTMKQFQRLQPRVNQNNRRRENRSLFEVW